MEAVHAVLMLREAGHDCRAAWGAARDRREGFVERYAHSREFFHVWRLADVVAVERRLEAGVVAYDDERVAFRRRDEAKRGENEKNESRHWLTRI